MKKALSLAAAAAIGLFGCAHEARQQHEPHGEGSGGTKFTKSNCPPSCHVDVFVVVESGICRPSVTTAVHVFAASNIHLKVATPGYSFLSPASSAIVFKDIGQTQLSHVSGGPNQVTIHDKHSDVVNRPASVTYKYGVRVKNDATNAICELDPPIVNEYP